MRLYPTLSRLSLMLVIAMAAGAGRAAAQVKPTLPGGGPAATLPATKPTLPGGAAMNAPLNIYGTVKDLDGKPTRGVLIQFSNADNGQKVSTATTDSLGNYTKTVGVPGNQRGYIVVPSFGPYQLNPSKASATYSKRVDFTVQRSASSKSK